MKRFNNPFVISICLSVVVFVCACSSAREISSTATPEEITRAINTDSWKFFAQNVSPVHGRVRNLTSDYFVNISNNKLLVALPYYGRLNSPSGAFEGNPLDFTSTSFELSKSTRSDGGWIVTVKNPDPEVQSMIFTFFDNGNAQLNITMTNRSGISYSGRVMPLAK